MFENLSKRLSATFDKIRGRGALTASDINTAMREIRVALLEADVALPVVKDFIANVTEKALGQNVVESVSPGQMVIKIVHDHLVEALGEAATPLNLQATPPVVFMVVGLQGSGKTTTTAKLARFLSKQSKKKVLMASLDIYRPAAQEQLESLGRDLELSTLPIVPDEKPLAITDRALETARREGHDVLLLDTAGRLHIDDALMIELSDIKAKANPTETLLVADALSGQDAVTVADTFNKKLDVSGIILTRVDGDARGGAALSMRAVTGCPLKFIGVGERPDQFETFHPERIASRILDMGDVVTLVEKAAESIDQQEAERLTKRMEDGQFDFNDMLGQLRQVTKMGGIGGLMNMMPGIGKLKGKLADTGFDEKIVKHQMAIIQSMTLKERKFPKLIKAGRRKRIAMGSGTSVNEVNKLLKQHQDIGRMMKRVKKMGGMKKAMQGLFSRGT